MVTKNTVINELGDRELILTRLLNAPRETVFKAWTDPAQIAKWWGPKGFTNPVCRANAKPKGKIHIDMTAPDGIVYPCIGAYREVKEPERISLTIGAYKDGKGGYKLEVLYTVVLVEIEGMTELTLTGQILKADPELAEALKGMEQGWIETLDRLISLTSASGHAPLIMERTFNAPISKVWKAITDVNEMRQWYFDLDDFKPEIGFEFEFWGGSEHKKYLHLCRVTEVAPGKKVTYSWRYDGYQGDSYVSWQLFAEGDKTRLKLTHTGIETFPPGTSDFAKSSFNRGWTYFGDKLKDYIESI
jgi:uncharacterized protein YndB with AHSA1/START domain